MIRFLCVVAKFLGIFVLIGFIGMLEEWIDLNAFELIIFCGLAVFLYGRFVGKE